MMIDDNNNNKNNNKEWMTNGNVCVALSKRKKK